MNKLFQVRLDAYYAAGQAVIAYKEGCELSKVMIDNRNGNIYIRHSFWWSYNKNGTIKQKSKRKWIRVKIAGLAAELEYKTNAVIENPSLFEVGSEDALIYCAFLESECLEKMISTLMDFEKYIRDNGSDKNYSWIPNESVELLNGNNLKQEYGEYDNTVLLIKKHWKIIEAVANELLERKTLNGEEVIEIIKINVYQKTNERITE